MAAQSSLLPTEMEDQQTVFAGIYPDRKFLGIGKAIGMRDFHGEVVVSIFGSTEIFNKGACST